MNAVSLTVEDVFRLRNTSDDEPVVGGEKLPQVVSLAFYALIFLIGELGNSLVILIVVRKQHMRTITNLFIVNLAVADLMMCSLSVPFTPLTALMESWVFGEAICHILPMTLGVSVYVSTLTSTAIAIDRYLVIVHPFIPRMKTWLCGLVICIIWSVSCLISLPLAAYQQVNINNGSYVCQESWPKVESKKIFTLSSFVLQFLVPCCVITHCYWKVSVVLKRRLRAKLARCSTNVDRDIQEIRRKRRTNTMLIVMVCIFVFCWVPLNVLHITAEFDEQLTHKDHFITTFLTTHVIAMSSTVYNVFIYAYMNDAFKKEMQLLLGRRVYRFIMCACLRFDRRDRTASPIAGGSTIIKERNGNSHIINHNHETALVKTSVVQGWCKEPLYSDDATKLDSIELHSANAKCAIAIRLSGSGDVNCTSPYEEESTRPARHHGHKAVSASTARVSERTASTSAGHDE